MCGKYAILNVWKRNAHTVSLLNLCLSLVKTSDSVLVVDQNVRTANTNDRHTTLKPCGLGSKTVNGIKTLKSVLAGRKSVGLQTFVCSVMKSLKRASTCTELTARKGTYQETWSNFTKVATQNYIGEKGNGSRLFVA